MSAPAHVKMSIDLGGGIRRETWFAFDLTQIQTKNDLELLEKSVGALFVGTVTKTSGEFPGVIQQLILQGRAR